MIADALRIEIERYAARMRTTNPLFMRAAQGTLNSVHMAHYLSSIQFLISHTPVHLKRAATRAAELGDEALSSHFLHKIAEEQGHEAWAESDVDRVSARVREPVRHPVATMRALVAFIEETIDADPALYLSYILFAEYLIVLMGPEWLELLEQRCGMPRTSMTVIDNHAELDRAHTEEALDQIDELVGDPRKLAPMRDVLFGTIARFDGFSIDVVAQADAHHARLSAQAPAA